MATPHPNGFAPVSLTSWKLYYVPQSDTHAYRVGDVVRSGSGTDADGVPVVTLHDGSYTAVRGVIVAIDPGLPAIGGLQNGVRLSVPATKTQGYYLWVCDDPAATFSGIDDGSVPANLVAASVGSYCNFTPGGAAADGLGGSGTALASSTFGASSGACRVLQLAKGAAYGAGATWLVRFAIHELAVESSTPANLTPASIAGLGVSSAESQSRALTKADDGKSLIASGAPTFTVPTGLPAGFGVAAKGACGWAGGATITDVRVSGAANPWCALVSTGVDAYDVVGGKP